MAQRQRVLFVTNSELGQSTVALAVAHEFLLRVEYDVHIASFPELEDAVTKLNEETTLLSPKPCHNATFHTIAGKSMKQAAGRKAEFIEMHPPGVRGAVFAYQKVLPATFASWNGSEYMIGYSSSVEIINDVRPNIVIIDPLFSQAIDACKELGQQYVVLSPNTFKDHLIKYQPAAGALWKYPQLGSGFDYPFVSWYTVFANIYLTLRIMFARLSNPLLKEVLEYRRSCGLSGRIPSIFEGFGDADIVLPSTPDIELPYVVPERVTGCGPILPPVVPIAKSHPELEAWLQRAPTVLVNLGSHIIFDEPFALKFATALRVLLDRRPDIQILWKLKTQGDTWDSLFSKEGAFQIIAKEIADGRVRIEKWLAAQPIAILRVPSIMCMVHHGGSNSYHEAISAGVPQIVLPVWIDTYDFSTRVEYLGIGVWGSRTAAPRVDAEELSKAFIRVLASEETSGMQEKAKALAAPFAKSEGRAVACEKIIELMKC